MVFLYRVMFLLLLWLSFGTSTFAQRKVLGVPQSCKSPVDIYIYDESQQKKFLIDHLGSKDGRWAWMVTSDRDNNPVYEKPSTASRVKSTIHFRDQFYVTDEQEGWIQIIATRVERLKIIDRKYAEVIGWVPKEKMLLWTSSLADPLTKIHRKAFLFNHLSGLDHVLKGKPGQTVFNGPSRESKQKNHRINDFCFVFKKDTRNGMYLLTDLSQAKDFDL